MEAFVWLVLLLARTDHARVSAHRLAHVDPRARRAADPLHPARRRRLPMEADPLGPVRGARIPEPRKRAPRHPHAPDHRRVSPHAAAHVEDRAGRARGRQRLVGRRAVLRHARLAQVAAPAAAEAHRGGAGLSRWPVRRALPNARRLGDHPRAARHAAEGLAVPQGAKILRDDHPEGIRRPRVLTARELDGAHEGFVAQRHGIVDDRRAEFARPGRAAAALRHGRAEAALAPGPRERRRGPVLRAHVAARRLRRDRAHRPRRRRERDLRRPRDPRHPAQLGEALHHSRSGRDRARSRVQALRS